MEIIHHGSVYTFVLTEVEWYAGTEQQKADWAALCKREAAADGCQYASILVEPSPLLSISPIDKRHKVWGHTFEMPAEERLTETLRTVLERAEKDGVSRRRISRMLAAWVEIYGK